MNNWNSFKLGLIAVMVLASAYVLAPTVVRIVDGPQADMARQAATVQKNQKRILDVNIRFQSDQPGKNADIIPILRQRLALAGVPVDAIRLSGEHIEVVLGPGGRRSQVEALAANLGTVQWYDGTAVIGSLNLDAAGLPAAEAWVDVTTKVSTVSLSNPLTNPFSVDLTKAGLIAHSSDAAPATLLVAMDGKVSGIALRGSEGWRVFPLIDMAKLADPSSWEPTWRAAFAGTIPAVLTPIPVGGLKEAKPSEQVSPATLTQVNEDIQNLARLAESDPEIKGLTFVQETGAPTILISGVLPSAAETVVPWLNKHLENYEELPSLSENTRRFTYISSAFPKWFRHLLSNTGMRLGRDLQGGIDLTLQVELDDAVLAQVSRDARNLTSSAASETDEAIKALTFVRESASPVIAVSGGPLSVVQPWLLKRLGNYEYVDSLRHEGVETHRFKLVETAITAVETEATSQVVDTLRNRINGTGVSDAEIVTKGDGRVGIQLPGKTDLQQAIDAIGTTAVLEFRLVDHEFGMKELMGLIESARAALPEDQFYDPGYLNRWLHTQQNLPEDRNVFWESQVGDPAIDGRPLMLKGEALLSGPDVASAMVSTDNQNRPSVSLEFKSNGSRIFCEVTTQNIKKQFAILLDGQIRSAPEIQSAICGGPASIAMGNSVDAFKSAQTLALVLRTGSLTAPVSIGEVRTVGPTLGLDAIRSGSLATVIGSSLVFLFMTLWYRRSGLVANFTLLTNVLVMMALLALAGADLTLPGIAGIALTVGMAVDANIIIYERIREELKLGVNPRKSVDAGFEKAFTAIVDGNVTTAIAGIVLFSYGGSDAIKGFAVTMLVGIVTTLITALFVSRTLMEWLTRNSASRLSI